MPLPDAGPVPCPLRPTPDCPLRGIVVLTVEDSRFAAEAMRLICRRTGARLRRADRLDTAHRHLRAYHPDVVVVDLGLPDGPGEALIRYLSSLSPRPAILATSGDSGRAAAALAAGAAAFLDKPLAGVAAFLTAVLPHLPDRARLAGWAPPAAPLHPDPLALRDDLVLAADLLGQSPDHAPPGHAAGFVQGLARSAGDAALEAAARAAGQDPARITDLRRAVAQRLALAPGGLGL